jgi:predicted DsbA family dithiol-disulfide isomerase
VLHGDHYSDEVRADERRAQEIGVTGVPFFLFGGRYAVPGAQPATLLLEALNRAWEETQPIVLTSAGDARDVPSCDGDSCAI